MGTPASFSPASFASFGALLLYLRRRARLRQRDLAIAVGYSEAQIGRLENNQRLPDVPIVLAQFIPALGLASEPELAARLVQLAQNARASAPSPEEAPDAPASAAPPLGGSAPPIIGRAVELAAVLRLLAADGARCVTLTGPGGVGKTRLALQAAHDLAPHFGATCTVDLASVDAAGLALALAQALQLPDLRDANAQERLLASLRDRQLLLVLDSFEHLLDGAALVAAIIEAAPGVRLLVTSRERLRVWDEVVVELAGLPLPGAPHAPNECVELFLVAARRARRDFAPDNAELAAITRICLLVDGLPLGIELAAAWVGLCSCAEIEVELRRSLDFLQTNARGVPERQRSLRAAFEHSWQLFNDEERRVLMRLTVFRGSFTRAAAEAVCGCDKTERSAGLLFTLAGLANKSVLRRVELPGGSRYALHELVRQFAAEHLRARAEDEHDARSCHSQAFLSMLAEHEPAIKGTQQQLALATLMAELDNLRAALLWASTNGQLASLRRALPSFLVLFEWQNIVREGEALLGQIAARLRETPPTVDNPALYRHTLGLTLVYHGWFAFNLGEGERGRTLLQEGSALLADSDDRVITGEVFLLLGVVTGDLGDLPEAMRLIRASLPCFEAAGDSWRLARALYRLALVLLQTGEYAVAQHLLVDSAARIRAVGDQRATVFVLNRLGTTAALLGQHNEARRILQQNLLNGIAIGDRRGTAMTLYHMGRVAQDMGEHDVARYCLAESLDVFADLGDQGSVAQTLAQLAYSAAVEGDGAAAQEASAHSWQIARQQNMLPVALDLLVADAALALADGQAEGAVAPLTLVSEHNASRQLNRDRAARLLRTAEAALTPYAFAAARARGQALTVEAFLDEPEA